MTRERNLGRRDYLRIVGAVSATTVLAGCQGASGNDTITPGTASGFIPFEFRQDGELVGFDISLTAEVIDRTEFELAEWTDTDLDSLNPSLTEDDIDFVAAPMMTAGNSQEAVAFTDTYYEPNQAVLVAEDDGSRPESVDDLSDIVVGARVRTTGLRRIEMLLAEGKISEDNITQYDEYTQTIQGLETGDVDAIITDSRTAENIEANHAVTIAFVIETDHKFQFRMRREDERIDAVDDAIAEVIEDGTYDELVGKWFTGDL